MKRMLALLLGLLTLAGVGVGYATFAAGRQDASTPEVRPLDLTAGGQLLFVDTSRTGGRRTVGSTALAAPDAARTDTGLRCERFSVAAGTAVCLQTRSGPLPGTDAVILDGAMKEKRRIKLAGTPSRARVSASGAMISWTVFVTGDSYNKTGFSTWTGILDTRTGFNLLNIEGIPLTVDGKPYRAADVNFWGVTFAADDNRFYATVATNGRTYLVEGDYANWEAHTLRENVECPSLSPDGTRIAFKKRVDSTKWRLHVLDLATMRETPLAERESIDDQAVWLDADTVMYNRGSDLYATPADGTGTPHRIAEHAASGAAVG
ncbi:hypothetical protein [Streptomyces sp. SID3343]|uniref:hypothetical protein n=1 Tax=Streptomyces sp. SID3343 TaxID=2690260 RepID=UPI00136EA174|nr:hypothetical protein [Streptomyces sp. SID3343]MYW02009.1 hypothetical protein [Streptomyces sp. SID3343]